MANKTLSKLPLLLQRLKHGMAFTTGGLAPRRGWGDAKSREIQLEFDFRPRNARKVEAARAKEPGIWSH